MHFLKFALLLLCLSACAQATSTPQPGVISTDSPQRQTRIAANPMLGIGKEAYNLRCGHCHGFNGEGQLIQTVENTLSLGMSLVPAHDSTGHTWQHPDQLLLRVIKEGISNPLDQFPMEPYAEVMTDDQINAVISYIKLWWTDEQRQHQRELTENWARIDERFAAGGS